MKATLPCRSLLALAVLALGASSASALDLGGLKDRVSVRVGVTQITPDVTSGDLTAPSFVGTKADIGAATQISGGITYWLDHHWTVDLPLALPFEHEISGAGAIAGVGKIGSVKALPMTVLAQYRFGHHDSKVRPYVGLGLTYAKFFKARSTAALTALTGGTPANPTTMEVDSKFGASFQIGATVQLQPKWSLNVSATHLPLETRTTLSTGQTLDAKLDPTAVSLEIVYKY